VNIDGQAIEMSKALYILKASLHGIMTVAKTYKDYSSNSMYSEFQSIWKDSGIMIDVKLQLLVTILFRLDALAKALSVIATATWLGGWVAGWVSVTLRYCIKMAKPIGKLFRPSESPIILVF